MGSAQPVNDNDLLWGHLQGLPAFRALLRAVEARFYQDLLPLNEPVLDLGCGDGHFTSLAFPSPLTVGIDPSPQALREAHQRGAYTLVVQSLGGELPFPSAHFATVISNSVLEHIPELGPVLAEIARVLRPGARFIFCVPSDLFTQFLFFSDIFDKVGLSQLATAYQRYFNRISRHHHCEGPQVWRERLAESGLELGHWFYYFSRRANHALDVGHYFGAPSLLAKKTLGRWILVPARWNLALTERWLRPLYEEALPDRGAYLFFVAQKPEKR
jgi:SAM-dependent methyltransferase